MPVGFDLLPLGEHLEQQLGATGVELDVADLVDQSQVQPQIGVPRVPWWRSDRRRLCRFGHSGRVAKTGVATIGYVLGPVEGKHTRTPAMCSNTSPVCVITRPFAVSSFVDEDSNTRVIVIRVAH